MTCIAGLVASDNSVWLCGDSAAIAGYSATIRQDEKVWRTAESDTDWVFGFTWSFRMGQLLRYRFTPPPISEYNYGNLHRYMCTAFIDELRKVFKEGGFSKIDSNVESGGSFLVGVRGRLFEVESDFQVSESLDSYAAIGCGSDIALGTLWAVQHMSSFTPERKLTSALEAATRHSAGVLAPYNIVQTRPFTGLTGVE